MRNVAPAGGPVALQVEDVHYAFSNKVENLKAAVALHFADYNFVRIHKTLRTTPAMATGVTERLWEMSDVVDVLEAWEAVQARHN